MSSSQPAARSLDAAIAPNQPPPSHRWHGLRSLGSRWLPHLLFWGWNGLFLCLIAFSIAPELLPELWPASLRGEIPWSVTASLLLAMVIPLAAVVVGVLWLRRRPGALLGLFYGLEGPLFLLCLARLFLLRELSTGMTYLALCSALAAFVFGGYIFGRAVPRRPWRAALQLAGSSLALLLGLYLGLLLAFYVVPAGWLIAGSMDEILADIASALIDPRQLLAGLYACLFLFTAALFLALPLAMAWLYVQPWRRRLGAYREVLGARQTYALTAAVLVAATAGFAAANHQPQRRAFERLSEPVETNAAKRRLLAASGSLRRGLVNAYLGSYRYVSSTRQNTHIRALYSNVFDRDRSAFVGLERFYNVLASPLLYDGESLHADQRRASELYAAFFDTPIQKAEQRRILHAVGSTWNRDQAAAGLLDAGERKVWIARQEVTLEEAPGWAEVELHEVYENRTWESQEILYYFSLPESAVLTGLWLGGSPEERYPFVVAPRGAAQAVYRAEVRRNVDPALLEQVGPRQYRLRAFPVPARPRDLDRTPPRLHLWMTLRVPATAEGWPLPRLAEHRNAFWNSDSERLLQGEPISIDGWLPSSVPVRHQGPPPTLRAHLAGYRITATPTAALSAPPSPVGSFAVVLDTSRSMARLADEAAAALARLRLLAGEAGRDVDLYLTAAGGAPRRLDDIGLLDRPPLFYGALTPDDLLGQYLSLRAGRRYDAVLVLTDDGAYDSADDTAVERRFEQPLWLVHLGGTLPVAYEDAIAAAVTASGGGVAGSLEEVFEKLSHGRSGTAPGSAEKRRVADGYLWSFEPAGDGLEEAGPAGFAPVAARQLILALTEDLQPGDLGDLDTVHAIAKRHGVVSPYSSMLVLLNERQRKALEKAENDDDRFERESENGVERLRQPHDPFAVSGVPEPEEWILLLSVAAALVVVRLVRR